MEQLALNPGVSGLAAPSSPPSNPRIALNDVRVPLVPPVDDVAELSVLARPPSLPVPLRVRRVAALNIDVTNRVTRVAIRVRVRTNPPSYGTTDLQTGRNVASRPSPIRLNDPVNARPVSRVPFKWLVTVASVPETKPKNNVFVMTECRCILNDRMLFAVPPTDPRSECLKPENPVPSPLTVVFSPSLNDPRRPLIEAPRLVDKSVIICPSPVTPEPARPIKLLTLVRDPPKLQCTPLSPIRLPLRPSPMPRFVESEIDVLPVVVKLIPNPVVPLLVFCSVLVSPLDLVISLSNPRVDVENLLRGTVFAVVRPSPASQLSRAPLTLVPILLN